MENKIYTNDCKCKNWARDSCVFLTSHHKNCEKYDSEKDAAIIIRALLRGIEAWAADEDGVHPDCWEAYKIAKFSVGDVVIDDK